jgi:hypothetical protein
MAFKRFGLLGILKSSVVDTRGENIFPVSRSGKRSESLGFIHKAEAMGHAHIPLQRQNPDTRTIGRRVGGSGG